MKISNNSSLGSERSFEPCMVLVWPWSCSIDCEALVAGTLLLELLRCGDLLY